jgi:hypothetical protein
MRSLAGKGSGVEARVGGNAVRIWVAQVDEAAVRTTKDVDILIRPCDLPRMIEAMEKSGFCYRHTIDVDMFVEQKDGSARDAVHVVLSGQMVREDDYEANGGFPLPQPLPTTLPI